MITATAQQFHEAIKAAVSLMKEDRFQADVHPIEHYQTILDNDGILFLSDDANYGITVSTGGYIGSMFKNPTSKAKNVAKELLALAVENGGYFLEAYGTYLEDLYIKNKFYPAARIKFNEDFAPIGWKDSNLIDKPDVVFFNHCTNKFIKGHKGGGFYFETYDEAIDYAKN
jgi:hypothetical protein